MNKKTARIIAIILAFLMFLSVAMMAISALANPYATARVTEDQIKQLREEKREIEREKREIDSRINTIEFQRLAEMEKKAILDERIMLTGLEIDNINDTIEQYNMLIKEKEYEIVISQNREEDQLRRYKTRVRDMEENGIVSYLEVIFDSVSFSDFIARWDFVQDIMRADENAYRALQLSRDITEAAKVELELIKEELDDELDNLEDLKSELEVQLDEAQALIEQILDNLEAERQLRDQIIEDENRVQREINAAVAELEKQRERERIARLQAQQNNQTVTGGLTIVSGTGTLMWPVSGSITSNYGIRRHPVYGDNRMHNGIDIGAAHGTVVVAADSGTVVTSGYDASYGNYIVIAHGNGVTTLYAHLSTRSVSANTTVTKGQQIGLVGSTGVSTGAHLHFEVSVNGSRVNPLSKL